MTEDELRLAEKMYRCDRAIGLLRDNRLNRKDANELINATLNLLCEMRQQHNAKWMSEIESNKNRI